LWRIATAISSGCRTLCQDDRDTIANENNPYLFWLLYGLQLAGVRPRYKLPVQLETDHPLEATGTGAPYSHGIATQMGILEASWDYMRDFARRKGTAIMKRRRGRHKVPQPDIGIPLAPTLQHFAHASGAGRRDARASDSRGGTSRGHDALWGA
jgi:hypothetical protein